MKTNFEEVRKAYLNGHYNVKEIKGESYVAYTYNNGRNGDITAVGFIGRSAKPSFHYRFKSEVNRTEYVNTWIARQEKAREFKKARRVEKSSPHSLKEGDILAGSWGYDQTNVNFYQVVKVVSPHSVKIREITSSVLEWDERSYSGRCTANKGYFKKNEPEMLKRVGSDNTAKISSYLWVRLWDEQPKYFSDGH